VLGKLIRSYQGETLTSRGDAFATLARSIAGQQISVKAADSVWRRVVETLPALSPQAVLAATPESLRAAGLSQQKVNYLKHIAGHFDAQQAQVALWHELEDEALIRELVALKGVGRWTAEMMLIFHYQRPDIFPVADLGLLKALALHYNNGEKMRPLDALALAEQWRPWRSVATWYLWRALDPVPVAY
jgi:DNA-3-methyladenine glycosylase II